MSAESKMDALAKAQSALDQTAPARKRLNALFDADSFVELDGFSKNGGESAGVVTGYGAVDGSPVFAFAQDITANSGAVGKAHAAKIKKLYDLAAKTGAPVVGIYDSNGALLKEGNDALNAYGEMMLWQNNLSGVVPQVSVIAGTCAGCAAMIALSADFVVMSEKAELFMTAPFTAKANGEDVPGAGTAENAAKSGMAHIVAKDEEEAIAQARRILSLMPLNNLSAAPICEFAAPAQADAVLRAAAENIENADMKALAEMIVDKDSLLELHKDFAVGAVTGLATLGGCTVGVVVTTGEPICGCCCAKISRLVSICDAFQVPVVTLVNTKGFKSSAKAELKGIVREAAKVAHVYAEATTPKVCVVMGQAYGPAYVAFAGRNANSDITLAWPSAQISALAPETAVTLLYADQITSENPRKAIEAKYKAEDASPFKAAADGYVEDVIDPASTRDVLITTLDMLAGKRVSKLPKKHGNMPL
ncbi:MAG: carboxyl transferase [Oscillospiraceae bacterium]|jgi:acetyl-CoA carboxylase carboxyltransferase component|nr:carboxyl transferase [Oscillospiraceae bacterium]